MSGLERGRMSRLRLIAALALACGLAPGVACGPLPAAEEEALRPVPVEVVAREHDPALLRRGALLYYTQGCQACHRIGGWGGLYGPALTNVDERLTHEQIVVAILNGGVGMPAYAGKLEPGQLAALVAFLEAPKEQQQEYVAPRDADDAGVGEAEDR